MDNQEEQESNQKRLPASFRDLLYDDAGNFSSMRSMSIIAFLAAIGLVGNEAFYSDAAPENIDELIKWLLLAAFAPKALQKFAEAKESSENKTPSPETPNKKNKEKS